ncbi:hypothetical protein [Pseudovibrio ascidiaceicola]|uniref:hypothetical protein n=1 Tax=Pseudovibrio ascidiaceicola TaxID=285279 RepID=UPI000D692840|nr:hypothetical protein [Pseudovibrio ascidiaceicola]
MTDDTKQQLRYDWVQTWADRPDDYIVRNPYPPQSQLRVYRDVGPEGERRWWWGANATIRIASGYADGQLEAQLLAEQHLHEYIKQAG